MIRARNRGDSRRRLRLRSLAGRWCLAAAVGGLAGAVSLYRADPVYADTVKAAFCNPYTTLSCPTCPSKPSANATACAILSSLAWGVCSSPWFSDCFRTNINCNAAYNCKSGKVIGPCPDGMLGDYQACQ